MNCPKCKSKVEKVKYKSIMVDRCSSCKGLWFDMLEVDHLRAMEGSEEIDTGDPDVGAKYDKLTPVECPKCHVAMHRKQSASLVGMWYDYCDRCHGNFFDAGEFTDYKEDSVLDFFSRLYDQNES